MKSSTKSAATGTKKKTRSKLAKAALSTCPAGGAGWCPYPFSIEQLEKKLKARAQENETASQPKKKKVLVHA